MLIYEPNYQSKSQIFNPTRQHYRKLIKSDVYLYWFILDIQSVQIIQHLFIYTPRVSDTDIANERFPLMSKAGKTFPALPARAQPQSCVSGKLVTGAKD